MKLTYQDLYDLAVKHNLAQPDVAAAVAIAESGGDPKALGDLGLGISRGLWQINLRWHPEYNKPEIDLYDPDTNAQAAYAVSRGGTYWKPWATFNSGAYQAFMPKPASIATPVPPSGNAA